MSLDRQISMGDLLRAIVEVEANDPATRRTVAEMLGFEWKEAQPVVSPSRPEPGPELSGGASLITDSYMNAAADVHPHEDAAKNIQEDSGLPEDDAWIESLPSRNLHLPAWFTKVPALPELESLETAPRPIRDPLFRPDWTRALLHEALATMNNSGSLDIERTVERLARGEPLKVFPRLQRLYLGTGVQVLIDTNKSMKLFEEDQYAILEDIKHVVSEQMVEGLFFTACPTRGTGTMDEWPWENGYRPARPGRLVLLLTDLGAARASVGVERSSTEEWLRFAKIVRQAGCPLVAFVPYPESRIPLALRRAMAVITWDRATTTGMVRRLRAVAHKRVSG